MEKTEKAVQYPGYLCAEYLWWSDKSNNGKSPAWYQPVDPDTPIYRVYNPDSGEHHLTMDKGEVDALVKAGWKKDDNELNGCSGSDRIKLYRTYNPSPNGFHHYTADKNEFDSIVKVGWKDESHQEFWVAPANTRGK